MHLFFRTIWHLLFVGRLASKLGFYDMSRSPFRVWPTDLDLLFHMNNGKYLSIMDIARYDLIQRNGVYRLFRREGWYPVVVGQTISYRKSLNPWQKFWIESRILGFDDVAVYLEQRFVRLDANKDFEVYARAFVRARVLRSGGGTVPVTELLEKLGTDLAAAPDLSTELLEWGKKTAMPSTRAAAPSEWD